MLHPLLIQSALHLHSRIADYGKCRRGSIAIVAALVLPAVIGCVGMAIDYGRLVRVRGELQSMVDGAAIAAIKRDNAENASSTFSSFMQTRVLADVHEGSLVSSVDSFDGETLRASATVSVPMTFVGILGIREASIKVTAVAQRSGYQELFFAIDLSASLGMGATDADRQALEQLTQPYTMPAYGSQLPQGCAFGCHHREGWEPEGKTVYQMAREAGITLREDELKIQFGGLVDLLLDPQDPVVQKEMRKVSVIGFSNYARQLITPSSSASAVKSSIDSFSSTDRYETYFANAFSQFESVLGTQGSGSQENPWKTLIMITDGIESRSAFFAQSSINTDLCTQFKNKGFRLAIVEIKYPKLVSNNLYNDTVLPVENNISPALSQCASSGWYFQAINNVDTPAKFEELKQRIVASGVRLTD